ncbi:MAG: DUF2989 domain-containing protein [Psychromonas sp.]|nr:DUF2989 domain-containing protein [Alteromonadales bacterium]MCP5079829.1 DUF2989 domain-containing protein [Psychromonas sp.]
MILKTAIILSIVGPAFILLTACDSFNSDNVNTICKNSPELCNDLHKIGDCRFKRSTVIRARHYDKIDPTESNKRKLLMELDDYESCLELTLFMEYTRNKNRNKVRMENFLTTQKLIKEHLLESKGTQDPMLAFYLWTRHQDMQAREVFLTAATKKGIDDPRLLFKLATIYAKDNPQEALDQFFYALQLSKSLDKISVSNFAMIMTIFYQHKQFEHAYVWALIAEKEDTEDEYPINLDLILRKGLSKGKNIIANEEQLSARAQDYYNQLNQGTFKIEAPQLIE